MDMTDWTCFQSLACLRCDARDSLLLPPGPGTDVLPPSSPVSSGTCSFEGGRARGRQVRISDAAASYKTWVLFRAVMSPAKSNGHYSQCCPCCWPGGPTQHLLQRFPGGPGDHPPISPWPRLPCREASAGTREKYKDPEGLLLWR